MTHHLTEHVSPCDIDWHPSLAERNEMERTSRGTERIVAALVTMLILSLLIVGWSMASLYFNSSAPVPMQRGGLVQSLPDVPAEPAASSGNR